MLSEKRVLLPNHCHSRITSFPKLKLEANFNPGIHQQCTLLANTPHHCPTLVYHRDLTMKNFNPIQVSIGNHLSFFLFFESILTFSKSILSFNQFSASVWELNNFITLTIKTQKIIPLLHHIHHFFFNGYLVDHISSLYSR